MPTDRWCGPQLLLGRIVCFLFHEQCRSAAFEFKSRGPAHHRKYINGRGFNARQHITLWKHLKNGSIDTGTISIGMPWLRITDPDRAEDLVQETFLAALKSRGNFKRQSSPKTWLTAILKHKIIDYLRKTMREQTWNSEEALDRSIDEMFEVNSRWRIRPHRWHTNPGDHFEQKEFLNVLYACLAGLPRRIARIFMMREMEGARTEEICYVMGITSTNRWTMLARARNESGRAMAWVIGDISCQALRTPGEWSCVTTDTPENN